MHDQANDLRRLVSEVAPLEAAGVWKVVNVPHGVRISTASEVHFDRLVHELEKQGYKTVRLRPVGKLKQTRFTVVVIDWDGQRMQAMLNNLRTHVRALTEELANCPTKTVELYEQFRLFDGYDRQSAVDLTLDRLEADRNKPH